MHDEAQGHRSFMDFCQFMASRDTIKEGRRKSTEWPKTGIRPRVVEGSSRRNHLAN